VRGRSERKLVGTGGTEGTRLYDADGKLTTDPARAVRGEIVEHDEHGESRRTWFLIEWLEIKWLPVSEPAFLLWVLTLFIAVWVVVALWLRVF
jgi:hypothetical protein